jgi:hypothetical protein
MFASRVPLIDGVAASPANFLLRRLGQLEHPRAAATVATRHVDAGRERCEFSSPFAAPWGGGRGAIRAKETPPLGPGGQAMSILIRIE